MTGSVPIFLPLVLNIKRRKFQVLFKTYFQKRLLHLVAVMIFTLIAGGHTISQAREVTIEEALSDDVVFLKVVDVKKGDTLSIRESTSYKSRKIGKIPANESCVAYLSEKKDVGSQKWVKITYKGVQGWVNLRYLKRNWDSPCGKYYQITNVPRNDVLNMRQSPTSSQKVGKISYDYEGCLTGLDKKQKWVLLDYEGTKGWVFSNYLKPISVDDCDI
jgi:hypothetical protein